MKSRIWTSLAPYIKVQKYVREGGGSKNPRFRLELKKTIPEQDFEYALHLTTKCVSCGEKIHPVRKRSGGTGYIAVTCPLSVNVACSRNHAAASTEYKRIAKLVG